MKVFHIDQKPTRELEVRAVTDPNELPLILVSCFQRKKGKFSRFTELDRGEAISVRDSLDEWIRRTQ